MTVEPRLIGFGGRKGAGKDAAAWTLESFYGFHRESFSVSIDLAVRELNPIIEHELQRHPPYIYKPIHYDEYVDRVCQGNFTRAKEHPEVRRLLDQTGSFGRSIVPSLWIDRAEERVVERMASGQSFAITGVRFPEEIEMVRRHGGFTIWISRPGHEDLSNTAMTENSVGPEDFDQVIVNNGSLYDLSWLVQASYIERFGIPSERAS